MLHTSAVGTTKVKCSEGRGGARSRAQLLDRGERTASLSRSREQLLSRSRAQLLSHSFSYTQLLSHTASLSHSFSHTKLLDGRVRTCYVSFM
jgi:hypothetical protein